jgi:uncharacterized membrane protein
MSLFNSFNDRIQYVLFAITAFLFLFSSGFVFFDPFGLNTIAHEMFRSLCHQFHWRSYSENGTYMAVCTRCFGIYAGLFTGSLLVPVIKQKIKPIFPNSIIILALAFLINLIDFIGNLLGIWTNTLHSRMLLGIPFGFSVTFLILTAYYSQKNK